MKMPEKNMVLKWLLLCNLALVTLYLLSNHIFTVPSQKIKHWFDLNGEANFPTWFSSAQLFLLFVLSKIYSIQIENKHLRYFYSLIGLVFLFFSIDETALIHEAIRSFYRKLSMPSVSSGSLEMWIFLYLIILIIFGFIFRKGILAFLNEKIGRTIFIIGAVVFVTGGAGLEAFAIYCVSSLYKEPILYKESILYIIQSTAEESFELLGQSLMIYALLSKLYSTHTKSSIFEEDTTNKAIKII